MIDTAATTVATTAAANAANMAGAATANGALATTTGDSSRGSGSGNDRIDWVFHSRFERGGAVSLKVFCQLANQRLLPANAKFRVMDYFFDLKNNGNHKPGMTDGCMVYGAWSQPSASSYRPSSYQHTATHYQYPDSTHPPLTPSKPLTLSPYPLPPLNPPSGTVVHEPQPSCPGIDIVGSTSKAVLYQVHHPIPSNPILLSIAVHSSTTYLSFHDPTSIPSLSLFDRPLSSPFHYLHHL